MKVIYDNIIFSLQKAGGISLVWYELSLRLLKNEGIDFKVIESNKSLKNIFRQILHIKEDTIVKSESSCLLRRYLSPTNLEIKEPFIFHSSYYRTSLQKNSINITTVHDFTYEYFVKGIPKYINHLQKALAIKNSKGIICVSNNTKDDLLHFFPKTDVNRIKVIYNGVSDNFKCLKEKTSALNIKFSKLINLKYVLFVGNRKRYKNFSMAIDTVNLLEGYSLAIAGGGNLTKKENRQLYKLIPGKFFIFPLLNDADLNILYNNAFCLLYPSLYEGFGLPVIEAMKAGCPVVATGRSSIPEIVGNAALLVDEISPFEFTKRILSLEKEDFRRDIIEKGFNQSKRFSWERCTSEVLQFYKEIYTSNS